MDILRNPEMLYTKNVNLTTTAVTEILKIPQGYIGHWNMLFISNLHNSTNDISIFIDKTPDPDAYIFLEKTVASKDYIFFPPSGNGVIVIPPGETIKANAGSAGNVEVIVTLDLVYAPFTFNGMNQSNAT